MTGDIFPQITGARGHLRLVPRIPAPRRRLAVRINVLDGHSAFGRAGPFRLTHDELYELIAVAIRIERRA